MTCVGRTFKKLLSNKNDKGSLSGIRAATLSFDSGPVNNIKHRIGTLLVYAVNG